MTRENVCPFFLHIPELHVFDTPTQTRNDINQNHYLRSYYPVHLQKDILQQAAFSTVLKMREEVVGVQQIICAWISRKWLTPVNSYGLDAKY